MLGEPTSLPPQPDELHHPVVVRENATAGDSDLLPQDKCFFLPSSVYFYHMFSLLGASVYVCKHMNMAPFVLNYYAEAFDRTTNRNVVAQRVVTPLPSPSDPVIFLRSKLLRETERLNRASRLFFHACPAPASNSFMYTAWSSSTAVTVFCCGQWKFSADKPDICLKPFTALLLSKQHLSLPLLWLQK